MGNAEKLYSRLFTLYNKTHAYHILTVKMHGAATLHEALGEAYETLEDLYDRIGEDTIVKRGIALPSMMKSIDKGVADTDMESDAQEIAQEMYDEYEALSKMASDVINQEKDVFYQNIYIEVKDGITKLCANMFREICEEEMKETDKEEKAEKSMIAKPKIGY